MQYPGDNDKRTKTMWRMQTTMGGSPAVLQRERTSATVTHHRVQCPSDWETHSLALSPSPLSSEVPSISNPCSNSSRALSILSRALVCSSSLSASILVVSRWHQPLQTNGLHEMPREGMLQCAIEEQGRGSIRVRREGLDVLKHDFLLQWRASATRSCHNLRYSLDPLQPSRASSLPSPGSRYCPVVKLCGTER